jgi:hypothetical protein
MLGFRMLQFYFTLLKNNTEGLIDHIKTIIKRKGFTKDLDKSQIKEISNKLLFNLSSMATFGITKRISTSIGLEELSSTFSKMVAKHPVPSIVLSVLAIKLDHYRGFPETEIIKFNRDNRKNFLALTTLQNLVIDYLYLYHTEHQQKQLICQELGIKMPTQLQIDAKSTVKKRERGR